MKKEVYFLGSKAACLPLIRWLKENKIDYGTDYVFDSDNVLIVARIGLIDRVLYRQHFIETNTENWYRLHRSYVFV